MVLLLVIMTRILYLKIYGTTSGYYDKKTGKTYYRV